LEAASTFLGQHCCSSSGRTGKQALLKLSYAHHKRVSEQQKRASEFQKRGENALPGIRPKQLPSASDLLKHNLTRPKQAIVAKTKALQDRLECLKMFAFTLLVQKRVSEAQKRVDNARLFDSETRLKLLTKREGS